MTVYGRGSDHNIHITLRCIAWRNFFCHHLEPRANELKMKGKENFHKSCTSVDISTSFPFWMAVAAELVNRQTH